jgi:uncharacterized protein
MVNTAGSRLTLMPDLPVLDPIEQRILGSLLEKQRTVPASYPLSLNALRTACNQTSSREPVTAYDDHELELAARGLKERGLLRIVWSDSGKRTLKYHQALDDALGLEEPERALLTVLLLRGPNAPGELRTRTERLHPFPDKEAVEALLRTMAERGLVRELERRPGQQDRRWIHLLGELPAETAPPPVVADLEGALRDGADVRDERIRSTYSTVAKTYAEHLADELDDLPFERWLLTRVAYQAEGPIADVGCGPGHVTAWLVDEGYDASGFDVTPEMIEQARARFPEVTFEVGDLRRLLKPRTAEGWGAVLALYSLIHLAPSELPGAVGALARTLQPGGQLLLGLHSGPDLRHLDSWWEHEGLDLDFVLHDPEQVLAAMGAAGLTDIEWYLRGPIEARGETTKRLYVVGRAG